MSDTAAIVRRRARQTKWDRARVARLGYLVGLGLEAKQIAADPEICVGVNGVSQECWRLGLSLRTRRKLQVADLADGIPDPVMMRFEAAAVARHCDVQALVRRLIVTVGSHDGLVDNILDDLS